RRAPDDGVTIGAAAISAPDDVVGERRAPDDVVAIEGRAPDDVAGGGRRAPDDVVAITEGAPDDVVAVESQGLGRAPDDRVAPGILGRHQHAAADHVVAPDHVAAP